MVLNLRILLVVLSALLITRNIGSYIPSTQFEIVEENSFTTKEESVLHQQIVLKKVTSYASIIAPFIPASSSQLNSQPSLIINRWLHHRAILI